MTPVLLFVHFLTQEILDAQVNAAREQYQPSTSEKIFAMIKSLIMRGLVIYFIMSFFRRPQPSGNTTAGNQPGVRTHATNLYVNGTVMVKISFNCNISSKYILGTCHDIHNT